MSNDVPHLKDRTTFQMKSLWTPLSRLVRSDVQALNILKAFILGLCFRPGTALKFLVPLCRGRLHIDAYKFHVLGPHMLKKALPAFKEAGMTPFLVFGTLLGQVREQAPIAHDNDFDIGLLDEDFSRCEELKTRLRARGIYHRKENPYEISFYLPYAQSVLIDVYRCYPRNGHMAHTHISRSDGKTYHWLFPADTFDGFDAVTFMRQPLWIPQRSEQYLAATYGDWKTPRADMDRIDGYGNIVVEDAAD